MKKLAIPAVLAAILLAWCNNQSYNHDDPVEEYKSIEVACDQVLTFESNATGDGNVTISYLDTNETFEGNNGVYVNYSVVAPECVVPIKCGEGTVLDENGTECIKEHTDECIEGFSDVNGTCLPDKYIPYRDPDTGDYSDCIDGYTFNGRRLCIIDGE